MASYNLAAPETQVIVTWLFEPQGYLDFAVRVSDGQTAREALVTDPGLDVTQWVRDNTQQDPATSSEVAMMWWVRANDQVNVTPPTRPPESAAWIAILQDWDASIDAGFARAPQAARNASTVPLYDETGASDGVMPSGAHLAHQQQVISRVVGVLS